MARTIWDKFWKIVPMQWWEVSRRRRSASNNLSKTWRRKWQGYNKARWTLSRRNKYWIIWSCKLQRHKRKPKHPNNAATPTIRVGTGSSRHGATCSATSASITSPSPPKIKHYSPITSTNKEARQDNHLILCASSKIQIIVGPTTITLRMITQVRRVPCLIQGIKV